MNDGQSNIYESEGDKRNHEKLVAGLCYVPFGFFLPAVTGEGSPFVLLHAKQGAILFVAYLVLGVLGGFVAWLLFGIAYVVGAGWLGWNAFLGETILIPYVGEQLRNMK